MEQPHGFFYTFEQSFFVFLLQQTLYKVIVLKAFKLDSGPDRQNKYAD